MALAVVGVLIVSLEREAGTTTGNVKSGRKVERLQGYALALITVALDVSGSVLTKRFGSGLGPWAIGGIRFGFAAVCMGVTTAACRVLASLRTPSVKEREASGGSLPCAPWYEMPTQSSRSWGRVTAGVFFVTFLSPAMSNRALFAVPLSLCLTLGSLSPIFCIPLVWLMKRERVSGRSIMGSVLAVLGVVAFCNTATWR